ncbi:MAG: choice-of-anchor D domain-containing protein, partial [Pirellulales bacterium]
MSLGYDTYSYTEVTAPCGCTTMQVDATFNGYVWTGEVGGPLGYDAALSSPIHNIAIGWASATPQYLASGDVFNLYESANVVAPQMHVLTSAGSEIPNDGSRDFGATEIETPKQINITIENQGAGELLLEPNSLVLPDGFSVVGSLPGPIPAYQSAVVTLQFDPSAPAPPGGGAWGGPLSFGTNDPQNPTFTLNVTGEITGIAVSVGSQYLASGQSTVDLGSTTLAMPRVATVNVTNYGPGTLNLGTISVTGAFTVPSQYTAASLAVGASTSFMVELPATSLATDSGNVSIASSDQVYSPFTFNVIGSVAPLSLNAYVSDVQLVVVTYPNTTPPSTSDPRITGVVNATSGTFVGQMVSVQFSNNGDGTISGSEAIASPGDSFNYDPRLSDPSLTTANGTLNLQY